MLYEKLICNSNSGPTHNLRILQNKAENKIHEPIKVGK